mgnify:CR=1 FL=1
MAQRGFNLLRPQLTPPTAWDKVYKWMVGTARVIVILVEMVVIIAFAVRIVVDTIGKQLDDEIKQKDTQLDAYTQIEKDLRDIQVKADAYKDIWKASSYYSDEVIFINNLIKKYGGTISVQLTKDEVNISGSIPLKFINELETAFKDNMNSMKEQEKLFKSVELVNIDSAGRNEYEEANFTLRAKLIERTIYRSLK